MIGKYVIENDYSIVPIKLLNLLGIVFLNIKGLRIAIFIERQGNGSIDGPVLHYSFNFESLHEEYIKRNNVKDFNFKYLYLPF
jgi:hypothetical protein